MSLSLAEPQRFGAYLLVEHLGRGGMADVFLARREGAAGFERTVVVKRILSAYLADPHFVEMFINEAKVAARLMHPNIVQVYDLGELQGEFFIAMEYVNGKDLLRLLSKVQAGSPHTPGLPPKVAAYVAREVCRGLGHAHDQEQGGRPTPIVHRDVSPQNIVLSYDGHVKLVDFGIAKAKDSMREETRTQTLKGKFAYMSPEQLDGASPNPLSDIFAAGVVLHEMLTGRRLFKGVNDFDTMSRVRKQEIERPSRSNPVISPDLDEIVLNALGRDQTQRYQRAALMARDLDGYLQSARFSVEEMAEFLNQVFPASQRERRNEPQLTDSPSMTASIQPPLVQVDTPSPVIPPAPVVAAPPAVPEALTRPGAQPRPLTDVVEAKPAAPKRPPPPPPPKPPVARSEPPARPASGTPLTPAETKELAELSQKIVAKTATDEEQGRWRTLRSRGKPSVTETQTGPSRATQRIAKKLRLGFTRVTELKITFTNDMSSGGLRMRSPQLLPDGILLLLQLYLGEGPDSEPMTVAARVAWSKRQGGHFDVGVEFVGLRPDEKERLDAFLLSAGEG